MKKPPEQSARVFIDEYIEIHEGEEAVARLKSKKDLAVIDSQQGILRVDQSRWEEAQRYERRTWLERNKSTTSDRNEYHRRCFANYQPLRNLRFTRGIELGCGPFTNMRLILEYCHVAEVHLLDPLLNDYLRHPFCRYRASRLGGIFKEMPTVYDLYDLRHPVRFFETRLNAYRVGGLRGRQVMLEPSMIETYETDLRFDLVVIVNVIEHCLDAEAVFDKVLQLLLPEGVLVYADRIYHAEKVKQLFSIIYDAGHPLKVDNSVINRFLTKNFQPLMRAEYFVEQNFRGVDLSNYELYFIGKRLISSD